MISDLYGIEMDDKYARIGDLKRLVTQKREIKDHGEFWKARVSSQGWI